MFKNIRKSQVGIEYMALIIIVCTALIAAAIYLKRSIQGKARVAADVYGGGLQYE